MTTKKKTTKKRAIKKVSRPIRMRYGRNYSDSHDKFKHRHAHIEFDFDANTMTLARAYQLAQVLCAIMGKQEPVERAITGISMAYHSVFGGDIYADFSSELSYLKEEPGVDIEDAW